MEENNQNNQIKIPRHITINNYIYSYKDELKNKNYSFRCKNRLSCKIIIKVSEEEILKYIKKNDYEIKYEISSEQKSHTCKTAKINEEKDNINTKEKSNEKNTNLKLQKERAKILIFSNLNKSLSFHYENLKNNDIFLSKNQIKRILQKLREAKFPNDIEYLKDISQIKITFENIPNMENVNLCYKFTNIINPQKNNVLEKYIIFTTNFQINLLKKCNQILIDGTFKSAPKNYYQINIIIFFF